MPKRRVTTAKQRAASRKNLEKARAAKISRARYKGKSELPHVSWEFSKYYGAQGGKALRVKSYDKKGNVTGELFGIKARGSKTLVIKDISKITNGAINAYHLNKPKAPTLEPGISLLTAAARVAGKNPMKVTWAVEQADAFYELTGAKRIPSSDGFDVRYLPAARKRLAGRRIVRTRPKQKRKK